MSAGCFAFRLTLLSALLLASFSRAQERPGKPENAKPAPAPIPEPVTVVREAVVDGKPLRYSATSGFIPLNGEDGSLHARVFHIAYQRLADGATTAPSTAPATQPDQHRPITFVFNGGPGAGSLWLHLGTAGPMRVDVPEDGSIPAPPYGLKPNPYSWLDFTDLVFIDPVGTGFSRAEDGHRDEYYSVRGDISSVADVIRIYLTEHGRWLSPKFIAGESYGTTRAAGLSEYLHDRYGIDANGIVLISTVLNFQTLEPAQANDTAYPLWLPSYAAIAWQHHKLSADLQKLPVEQVAAQARDFATDRYGPALLRGSGLSDEAFKACAAELAKFTGLPLKFVKDARLRVGPERFEKQLLADEGKIIGRMDGRITADAADTLSEAPEFDPSLTGYIGIFSSCFNAYVRGELHFESALPYEFLAHTFAPQAGGEGYLDVSNTLRKALSKVPAMKVNICSGWFDLATPFFATEYTINQLPLSPALRKNITQTYYDGGHMLYMNHPALVKLHDDLKQFYSASIPATQPSP